MASYSELEFNKHRCLQLLNLPPCTEKEVRNFLVGLSVKSISLSESLDSAIVHLAVGRQFDDAIAKFNDMQFKDNTIVVKPGASLHLMGVAHIPMTYTDKNFKELCESCGPVEYAYIMRANKSGLNKGYGIVEFKGDLEQVKKMKEELDWKEINGQLLHADFVDPVVQVSYELMQSKCLLVTGMKESFTDVSKMREFFGCVTSPVYCQLIVKDDKCLGYGIVEYRSAEEAEDTWQELQNKKIEDTDVVISFCIPGKSAVVVNNRIVWKYGDKSKSSLLPDPLTAKPVIAGNAIVISMCKMNPNLMDDFTAVLAELQQAYVSQMMSPVNRPGLLGPAPSLPLSPMMNPNMQLGLIIMLAVHIQIAKQEKFTGVLAKQLNTLSEQEVGVGTEPKPSILGDPMTGQANVILNSLKQQLNQVALKDSEGNVLEEPTDMEEKLRFIVKKFVANGRYLNLSLLTNLGQLLVTMKQAVGDVPKVSGPGLLSTPAKSGSLLGPVPDLGSLLDQAFGGGGMGGPRMGNTGSGLMPTPNMGNKNSSLLGDAPNMGGRGGSLMGNAPGRMNNANNNQSMGSGGGMNNLSQTLLGQISQGLVHQIGQNLMYQLSVNPPKKQNQPGGGPGKGLLGDMPQGPVAAPNLPLKMGNKNSLLGEPPNQFKGNPASSLDQGSWKGSDNRWGGASNYESGYGNKSNMGGMGGNFNDYGYGQDSYSQDMGGNYGGGYGGGYNDNDFYNSYQQYSSNNFGAGQGFGSGGGGGAMSGGSGNYGMGGGMLGNQASGVNFQDGQSFGKGNSSGLGQDNARYGGGDGYGGNMGNMNYGYGRDDMGDGVYDSYRSVGMGGGYSTGMNDNMGSGMGIAGNMGGMGNNSGMAGMGNNSGMGGMGNNSGMAGMGNNSGMAGMGSGMGGMGSGMGLMGSGGTMGGSGNMGMTGFGNSYSTSTGMGVGGGSGGNSNMGASGNMSGMNDSSFVTGMGSGRMGMSGSGSGGNQAGMGMMGAASYMTGGAGVGGNTGNKMSGAMSNSNVSGFGAARDQNSSYYQNTAGSTGGGGASGLLPAPGKFLSPGQKRTYNQFLPRQETNTETTDYMGQHSQGLASQYMDSFKRSRLY